MPGRLFFLSLLVPLAIGCADDGWDESYLDEFGNGKADAVGSELSDRLVDIPFYFGLPKSSVTVPLDRPKYKYPTLWNRSTESDEVGLRIIAVDQGSTLSSRKAARREMANGLAAAGVLQTGDIILSFRPELAGTMAYPHIQMGTTHAGMVIVGGAGTVFNVDSPLDSEYLGRFDAEHYAGEVTADGHLEGGTHALHVIRPRIMDDARRQRLTQWVAKLEDNLGGINGERRQVKFQSDYLMPSYVAHGATPRQMVTTLGKIILEADTESQTPMYCSEFAWHMLALSNCTEEEILNAPEEGAACAEPPFEPMPLVPASSAEVGIAEGPLKALMALPEDQRAAAVAPIFADGNASGLSSGHRAVAESVAPLMGPLSDYYAARVAGGSAEDLGEIAAALGNGFAKNYSPTAYFIQAMDDEAHRTMDYVVTIAFVDSPNYAKAKELAQLPVP